MDQSVTRYFAQKKIHTVFFIGIGLTLISLALFLGPFGYYAYLVSCFTLPVCGIATFVVFCLRVTDSTMDARVNAFRRRAESELPDLAGQDLVKSAVYLYDPKLLCKIGQDGKYRSDRFQLTYLTLKNDLLKVFTYLYIATENKTEPVTLELPAARLRSLSQETVSGQVGKKTVTYTLFHLGYTDENGADRTLTLPLADNDSAIDQLLTELKRKIPQ